MQVQSLDPKDPLEKSMATHSSVLAWRITRTEEPSRLQSIGSHSWTRLKHAHRWQLYARALSQYKFKS